jgi:hypothetical protein
MMLWLFFFLGLTFPATLRTTEPETIDKTPRMAEIETKYHVKIVAVIRVSGVDNWCFMVKAEGCRFTQFPVVTPENSTDAEFEVAVVAAENVAVWYEANMKRNK